MFRNLNEAVSSIGELYSVGTFAQIIEMREQGPILELVLNAQRRIRLLEKLDESTDEDMKKPYGKINGRRARKSKEPPPKKQDEPEQKPFQSQEVIFGKTENIKMDPIERTVELKVSYKAFNCLDVIRVAYYFRPLCKQSCKPFVTLLNTLHSLLNRSTCCSIHHRMLSIIQSTYVFNTRISFDKDRFFELNYLCLWLLFRF